MSSFKAVNSEQDDEIQVQEDYTRELQVEQGYKIYNLALTYYKDHKYDAAIDKFDELLEIEILKPDKLGAFAYNSPAVDKLRYLSYRNRGFLYFDYLKQNYSTLDNHTIVDDLIRSMESLLEAICHDTADYKCIELLLNLLAAFDSKRLQRWVLETELFQNPLIMNSSILLPQWKSLIATEKRLIDDLKDNANISIYLQSLFELNHDCDMPSKPLCSVLDNIYKMKKEDEITFRQLDVDEIVLKEKTWECVTECLETLLPTHKTAYNFSSICDPYNDLEDPIESVFIKVATQPTNDSSTKEVFEKSTGFGGVEIDRVSSANDLPVNEVKLSFLEQQELKQSDNDNEDNTSASLKRPNEERPQRISKRVREKVTEQESETKMSDIQDAFLGELNLLFRTVGFDFYNSQELASLNFFKGNQSLDLAVSDLYDCIASWSNKHSDILKSLDSKKNRNEDTTGLKDFVKFLKASIFNGEASAAVAMLDDSNLDVFLESVNSKKMHFQQVRAKLLYTLLQCSGDGVCYITDRLWTSNLYKMVEYFVLTLDEHLFELLSTSNSLDVSVAVAIYEILVNLLHAICKEIAMKSLQNHRVTDLDKQKLKLLKKIHKWQYTFFQKVDENNYGEKSLIRYRWAELYLRQALHLSNEQQLIAELQQFKSTISQHYCISHCNYSDLPAVSVNDIENLILKYQIIHSFNSEDSAAALQRIDSLIKILSNDHTDLTSIETTMLNFLKTSPVQVKLQLWVVVFKFFATNTVPTVKIQKGFFAMLQTIDSFFSSSSYESLGISQRQTVLLLILGHMEKIADIYVGLINVIDSSDTVRTSEQMEVLLKFFKLFYSIINYEVMCSKDHYMQSFFTKAVASSLRLKSLLVHWSIIVSSYYKFFVSKIKGSSFYVARFLWNLHALYAAFQFCDISGNSFLKYSEFVLCQMDAPEVLPQVQQILFCRYHLQLTSAEHSEIVLHKTEKQSIEPESAIELGKYLIRYQYGNSNPLFNTGAKSSMKQIFDVIVEVIGEPTYESNFTEKRNLCLFDEYLNSSIEITLVRCALKGDVIVDLVDTNSEYEKVVKSGIIFVAAVQQFNIFKIRRKNNQARLSELDITRNLLKADIVYNSGRFESWYLLGKCYSYAADDDLTWTSDKLIALDKKKMTASLQRKSILCYIMSISTYNKTHTDHQTDSKEDQTLLADIFESLANILLLAWTTPMSGLCFNKEISQVLGMNERGEIYHSGSKCYETISEHNITRMMILCYNMVAKILEEVPSKSSSTCWRVPFNFSKIKYKIGSPLEEYKDSLLEACSKSKNENFKTNFIMEPHYFVVSLSYKLVRDNKCSIKEAYELLRKDNACFQMDDDFWGEEVEIPKQLFNEKCIKLLEVLISFDKKKWYHKPKYRIATIYANEFEDMERAISYMEEMVFAASPNKSLVTIWKPDYELPGKHFVYNTEYIKFYLQLLYKTKDIIKIGQVSRKLRKFGSSMLKCNELQDVATKLYVDLIHESCNIDEKTCVESYLPQVSYAVYSQISKKVIENCTDLTLNPTEASVFFETVDLRKGSYTQFDDLSIALYFKFFFIPCVQTDDDYLSTKDVFDLDNYIKGKKTANSLKKRVSKKECLEQISILCKKLNVDKR